MWSVAFYAASFTRSRSLYLQISMMKHFCLAVALALCHLAIIWAPAEGTLYPVERVKECYQAKYSVPVTSDVDGWRLMLHFSNPVIYIKPYHGILVQLCPDGTRAIIRNKEYNRRVRSGGAISGRFVVTYTGQHPSPIQAELEQQSILSCSAELQPSTTDVTASPTNSPGETITVDAGGRCKDHLSTVADPEGGPEQVVRMFYPKGSYAGNRTNKGGCSFAQSNAFTPGNSITLTYDIYFSPNFGFAYGGKLPGLYGGTGQCSGGTSTTTCFSTRFMWRQNGGLVIYAYLPSEKGTWFCTYDHVKCNHKYGHDFGRGTASMKTGQWQSIGQRVDLNTPGKADGRVELFYEGQSVFSISGLTFRNTNDIKINKLYFSTFFGGSSSTKYAAPSDCYSYFKNFRVVRHG